MKIASIRQWNAFWRLKRVHNTFAPFALAILFLALPGVLAASGPDNRLDDPPVVSDPIPNLTLKSNQTATYDLNEVFTDPDGDNLVFAFFDPGEGKAVENRKGGSDPSVLFDVVNPVITFSQMLTIQPLSMQYGTDEICILAWQANNPSLTAEHCFEVTVVNSPPVLYSPIADLLMVPGQIVDGNLLDNYSDIDPDALVFDFLNYDTNVIEIIRYEAIEEYSIKALTYGQTDVTVYAYDGINAFVPHQFTVSIPNAPPQVVQPVEDIYADPGDTIVLDANAIFSDPEGDPLLFSTSSTHPAFVMATSDGPTITLDVLAPGTATIQIFAQDLNNPAVGLGFKVHVNSPPVVIGSVPTVMIQRLESQVVDLTSVFSDPDGDPLYYAAILDNPGVAGISFDGDEMLITGANPGVTTVTLEASDADPFEESGATNGKPRNTDKAFVSLVFGLEVTNAQPEVILPIPDLEISPGSSQVIDLAGHIEDPDGGPLTYSALSSNPARVSVSLEGSILTLSGLTPGTAFINVTGIDPDGGSVSVSFFATVANLAPVVIENPGAIVKDLGESVSFDLTTLFSDPEQDPLEYSVVSSNPSVASAVLDGNLLTVTAVQFGSVTVTVSATDLQHDPVVLVFTFRSNREPYVDTPLPPFDLLRGKATTIDLESVFADADDMDLDFDVSVLDPSIVSAELTGSSLSVTGLMLGSTIITLTAYDAAEGVLPPTFKGSSDLKGTASWDVMVSVINGVPVVSLPLPDRTMAVNDELILDLYTFFTDPDFDDLTFSVILDTEDIVSADIVSSALSISSSDVLGPSLVEVTATDPSGDFVSATFVLTVQNLPPVASGGLPNQLREIGAVFFVGASTIFSDPEEDPLTFSAVSADPGIVIASYANGNFLFEAVSAGQTTVTLRARDAFHDNIEVSFVFTVNSPPEFTDRITNQELLRTESVVFDLVERTSDADGDDLSFSASVQPVGIVEVSLVGGLLKLTGQGLGSAVVTVLASDTQVFGGGSEILESKPNDTNKATISLIFGVDVVNGVPTPLTALDDRGIAEGQSFQLDLATLFVEPDDEAMVFSALASNPLVAGLALNGSILTVTGLAGGSSTIRLFATDPLNDVGEISFVLAVSNDPPVASGLPSQVVLEVGQSTILNGGALFEDPDGDPFTISAVSAAPSIIAVSVTNNLISLSALQPGTVDITLSVQDDFNPPVPFVLSVRGNAPPIVETPIPPITLLRSRTDSIDLEPVFSDPDGNGSLFYTAVSTNPSIVAVSVVGPDLSLRGGLIGQTTVRVRASDVVPASKEGSEKAFAEAVFSVRVINGVPVLDSGLPELTLPPSSSRQIDLADYFSDPDGEALTFTASTSNSLFVETSIQGSQLTISSLIPGTAVVSIVASDPLGAEGMGSFTVVVNRPPEITGTLSVPTLVIPGSTGTYSVDLEAPVPLFTDPDGDAIVYAASIDPPSLANTLFSGSVLQITASTAGSGTLTVTATDRVGGMVSFMTPLSVVENQPPSLTTVPTATGAYNQVVTTTATVVDDSGITEATLLVRRGEETDFTAIPMVLSSGTAQSGTYTAQIPKEYLTATGLDYVIEVSDGIAEPQRSANIGVSVRLPARLLALPASRFNNGSTQNDYRMISSPIGLDNGIVIENLSSALGAYNTAFWRLAEWRGSGDEGGYEDQQSTQLSFTPGNALWILTRNIPATLPSLGPGVTTLTTEPFEVLLHPGWNQVSSPFAFAIGAENVILEGSVADLHAYQGSYTPTAGMAPFHGYFVANNSDDVVPLFIYPRETPDASKTGVDKNQDLDWKIRIAAKISGNGLSDESTELGVKSDASDEYDPNDLPKPPAIGEFVSVSFDHPEWNKPLSRYRTDVRAPGASLYEWPLTVRSNSIGAVVLRIDEIEPLPEGWQLAITDELTGNRSLVTPGRNVVTTSSVEGRRFTLTAGPEEKITDMIRKSVPDVTSLNPSFPNPARGAVTLSYDLAEPADVRIEVFNILGQRIDTLANQSDVQGGRHSVVWNPDASLPSGPYIAKMDVAGRSFTQKIMLVR